MNAQPAILAPPRTPTRGEILLLGSLTAFGAITIDLYLPTLPSIARDFGVSPAAVQLTLSVFFIGMGLGQLVYGPVSDRLGRRPAILFGCALYVAASVGCALAPSIEWLVAGRFVQALGACAGMVVARAVVRDRYDHRDSARIFSLLVLVLAVSPMLAPTVGGYLSLAFSWRLIFAVQAVFGAAIGAAVFFRLDESRGAATEATARAASALHGYSALLGHRRFIGYVLVSALSSATVMTYIALSPDLMIDVWGFSQIEYGLVFAAVAVGVLGSSQVNRALLLRFTPDRILGVACLAAVVLGAVLMAVAVGGGSKWAVMAALFAALSTSGFVGSNALAGALNIDPLRAGAASGLFGAGTSAGGAVASALAAALHDGTPRPMAAVILGALVLAALAYFGLARPRPVA